MHLYTAHVTSPNHCPSIRARDYSRVSPRSKSRTTRSPGTTLRTFARALRVHARCSPQQPGIRRRLPDQPDRAPARMTRPRTRLKGGAFPIVRRAGPTNVHPQRGLTCPVARLLAPDRGTRRNHGITTGTSVSDTPDVAARSGRGRRYQSAQERYRVEVHEESDRAGDH